MPALPVIPGVIRLERQFKMSEDNAARVRTFLSYSGTAPTVAQLNTFAAAIGTSFGTNLKGLMTPASTLETVTVTDMSSYTGAQGVASPAIQGTRGSGGTGTLPASTAVVVSLEIARRYRGGHPRQYWPFGLSADMQDAQTWSSSFNSACATGFAADSAAILGSGWTGAGALSGVNVSQYSGFTVHDGTTGRARNVSTPRTSPIIDAVLSLVVRLGIGAVRKRLLGLA